MPDTVKKKKSALPPKVLQFKKPKTANSAKDQQTLEEKTRAFSDLAVRIERSFNHIEATLSSTIENLEHDIQKMASRRLKNENPEAIEEELKSLTSQMESRIQQTLNVLSVKTKKISDDKARLDHIKQLSHQLIKVLSFDFYKNALNQLSSANFQDEVDEFGMDYHFIQRIKPIFDYLYYKYWRVQTTGIENIPSDGRALIVGNHSGTLPYDGAMIKTAIMNEHAKRKDARFLVENFVYHMPFLGSLMYRIGGVRACQENAEYLLKKGHLVIVFPEGVKGIGKFYNQRYKLQRFGRGGFVKLCMRVKSPLIPVGVVGAEEIHPIIFKSNTLAKAIGVPYIPITPTFPLLGLLGVIPFPSRWSIHFGKPMQFDQYPPEAVDDDLLIHRLSETVRNDIQNILMRCLSQRRSVWFG